MSSDLQEQAKRHLWMHFTRMGSYEAGAEVPVIVRGEGCYVFDEHGKRYLDGLSALYCVNIGHGRAELGQAAADQASELGFYTNWSYAHPRSIELATRIAALAPGNLNRVFFTSGGSEAVESAWKLAKAYHAAREQPRRHKLVSRKLAYHGTSMGALTATGLTPLRTPFEPLTPGGVHVANTNSYRWQEDRDPLWAAESIEEAILFEGPETVAAVILEPVQNGERFGYQPDMITTAKGITSAYAPLGAVIAGDHIAEPFLHGKAIFNHGFTFGGHPVACATALANIDVIEREGLCEHVLENEGRLRSMLESLRDLPIVGDVRGAGYFHAIELVKDQETKETFSPEESEELLRGFLSGELYRRGLICRTDDRGDPIVQLSPPLIAGEQQFEEIEAVLRPVLSEASDRVERWSSLSRA